MSAAIELPQMSTQTYIKTQNILSMHVHETAWNAMQKAGEEERKISLEIGDIDSDGIPMCPVITDIQWSKGSYKTKYDALSGAVIVFKI